MKTHIKMSGLTKNIKWNDDLGNFKVRLKCEIDHNQDNFTRINVIKYADKQKLKDVRKEAYKTEKGCHCNYDCCGHWQSVVYRVDRINSKTFRIETSFYQNV